MTSSKKENSIPRPPVVVVMGHVDHGKTTLLDFIRKTTVASREAGGITQSVGAYEIEHAGKRVTFIDTPGHEAFACMRTQGAKSADLAILVVAADDSVKPQTKDALACIQAEEVPFIVAMTKIDMPGANVEKVKQDLAQLGVYLEGYGGNVSWHEVSGKTGKGVPELLDLVLLATDLEDLSYDPEAIATGIVVTSRLDKRRGILVGVILRDGTLKRGEYIATETASGKIKILENYLGKPSDSLVPSAPALIAGFETLPLVGEEFFAAPVVPAVVKKAAVAKAKAAALPEGMTPIPLVLKADEGGSLEALAGVVTKLSVKYAYTVAARSVGDVYESDVKFAENTGAVIIGFRTKVDKAAENLAHARKVTILSSPIIYELEKELDRYAEKRVAKTVRTLEVLAVFGDAKGKQRVVGGRIALGPVRNQESFEIWQGEKLIGAGRILNLQSQHADVGSAETGQEVGLLAETDEPVKVGERLVFAD